MNETLKNYVCEKCGGELREIGEGRYRCPYCRSEYFKETTLPDELILDLHSANRARSLQRFEDALNEYDRIIASYPDCFDAYWGATLSDYGIQYEKDYDGKMIPTVHRFSETPVTENPYFVSAVKYCKDDAEKQRITLSADEIERIRAEIKKTVGAQQPYDIFLCYKESPVGGDGGFTPEFYWASELYIKLRGEGYRVFFAKESLPAAKGDYEAHIFPALQSAKLMLILTTSVQHVESVWVKNEWSRFIRFSRENPSAGKRFKVIQSGFKPELLPRELRKEQVLNHDSMGWVEQLYGVIKDTFRDKEKEEEERKRLEAEAQAERFAKMLEQERKKWAAEEQKKQEAEKALRDAEEQKRQQEESRKRQDELDRRAREDAERRAREDERIKALERRIEEERRRNVTAQNTSIPTSVGRAETTLSRPTRSMENDATPESVSSGATSPQKESEKLIQESDGRTVSFGSYPQDRVYDQTLIGALNSLTGKLPAKTNPGLWTVYPYFTDRSGAKTKLMWYIDVTHAGEKYRGVYFTAYRNLSNGRSTGYDLNTVHWFKYQPVLWRKLEEKNGKALLFSEKLLDSQEFFHTDAGRRIGGKTVAANSYEHSDVREWLNSEFIKTAFSENEDEKILVTSVSCAASTTAVPTNSFAGGSVKDKVFLLSYKDSKTEEYGFYKDALYKDKARTKRLTDYAICQGGSSFAGSGRWWLRSPNASYGDRALYVDGNGFAGSGELVYDVSLGICPAIWASLDGKAKPNVSDKSSTEKADKPIASEKLSLKNGDLITFGKYKQNSDLPTDIEWQVLSVRDKKALVISKYGLDNKPINTEHIDSTWETCSLRKWLNNEFLSEAFSDEEKALIPKVTVSEEKVPESKTVPGNPTEDRIFVLSVTEAEKYFKSNVSRKCTPTDHAVSNGTRKNSSGLCCWWLRSPGAYQHHGTRALFTGEINTYGCFVNDTEHAVRPAMWISLDGAKGLVNKPGAAEETKTAESGGTKASAGENASPTNNAKYVEKELNDGFYKGYCVKGIPNGKGEKTYSNGDVYTGEFIKGKKEGFGKMVFVSGNVYEGEFKDGKQSGKGKVTYSDGDVYDGEWKDGKKQGHGKYYHHSGNIYEGNFDNGYRSGKGKLTFKDGDVFDGIFSDGKPRIGNLIKTDGTVKEGEFVNGTFKEKAIGSQFFDLSHHSGDGLSHLIVKSQDDGVYDGEAINEIPNGKGRKAYQNGDLYEGDWKDGKCHGKGKMTYVGGNVYEGEWKDGKCHGKGKMTYADGTVKEGEFKTAVDKTIDIGVYSGETIDGIPNGKGKLKYIYQKLIIGYYEGEFKNGKMCGQGKMKYITGDVYEGEWKNGVKHGNGRHVYHASGDTYNGEWKNGMMYGKGKYSFKTGGFYEGAYVGGIKSGKGRLSFPNGDTYTGEFFSGKMHGKGKYTFNNGDVYEGEWENGTTKVKGTITYKDSGKTAKGKIVGGVFKKSLF